MRDHKWNEDEEYNTEAYKGECEQTYIRDKCSSCGAYQYEMLEIDDDNDLISTISHIEYDEKEYGINFPCLSANEWIIKGIIE